jgi:hypothetical protein
MGPSGDFEIGLDTGEIVPGSRRFKAVAAGTADRSSGGGRETDRAPAAKPVSGGMF